MAPGSRGWGKVWPGGPGGSAGLMSDDPEEAEIRAQRAVRKVVRDEPGSCELSFVEQLRAGPRALGPEHGPSGHPTSDV